MEFPETADRFIAYFDIMGFKDLVYRTNHSTVSRHMSRISDNVAMIKEREDESLRNHGRKRKKEIDMAVVLPVFFSDSVLFVSQGQTVFDARKTAFVASIFLHNMLVACIPVKGALAFGRFTADFRTSKFFGRPLIDAYLLAEEIHFYGAVLHHSFEQSLYRLEEKLPETILKRKPIPMKAGLVTHSFVDWRAYLEGPAESPERLIEPFYRNVSGSTRRYVDNTRLVYVE